MNLTAAPKDAVLSFNAFSYADPRTVVIAVNPQTVASIRVPTGPARPYSVELTLSPGNNLITFDSPQAPTQVPDPKVAGRKLSFGMNTVALRPR